MVPKHFIGADHDNVAICASWGSNVATSLSMVNGLVMWPMLVMLFYISVRQIDRQIALWIYNTRKYTMSSPSTSFALFKEHISQLDIRVFRYSLY